MAPEQHARAADLVLRIELELRRLERWEATPPSDEALQSDAPFCCDRLSLEQWLQWIFLPRMYRIIEAGAPLPARSGIHAYAEESPLAGDGAAAALLELIRRFDRLIEGPRGGAR